LFELFVYFTYAANTRGWVVKLFSAKQFYSKKNMRSAVYNLYAAGVD